MLKTQYSSRALSSSCSRRSILLSRICRHQRIPDSSISPYTAHAAMTTVTSLSHTTNNISAQSHSSSIEQIVKEIHASPVKAALIVTGGAMQAIPWLLSVPGASNTVLDLQIPYACSSILNTLGKEPVKYCSEATAVDLAKVAYQRAADLSSIGEPIVGVSATCSLASEPPKRGAHRVYVATHDGHHTRVAHILLSKGKRTRLMEDEVASKLVIKRLAAECGVNTQLLELGLLDRTQANGNGIDAYKETSKSLADPLEALLAGTVRSVEFSNGQVVVDAPRKGRVYLPGSFNPLHEGHKRLLAVACSLGDKQAEGCFELSVGNADKGQLPLEEIRRRVQQFIDENLPVVVTSAPLFINKATLFSNGSFVVGFDTAHRLLMPKYYDNNEEKMLHAFDNLRHTGCRFIVAGRQSQNSSSGEKIFKRFEDLHVPPPLQDLFTGISESLFRIDISSSEIRKRMGLNH